MNHPNRVRLSKLSLGLLLALAAAPAFAQTTAAALGGRVVGTDNQPVTDAQVTIVHTPSGTVSNATTDASGRYAARGLRVGGPYTITITRGGQTETKSDVYLSLSEANNVDATIGAGAGTSTEAVDLATVQVKASREISVFSPDKSGAGSTYSREQIESAPSINRTIQDVVKLDPRVAQTDKARNEISVGGQNTRYNAIRVDGISTNDAFGLESNGLPTPRQPFSQETIDSISVDVANYDVTSSGGAGGVINAVTKSGTNDFHGSVFGVYRDNDMVRKNTTGSKFAGFEDEQTYGATFGGPLIKDKLFFFVNYEKFKQTAPGPTFGAIGSGASNIVNVTADEIAQIQTIARDKWGFDAGSASGAGNANTESEEYGLKIDWNITDSQRASFRYGKSEQSVAIFPGFAATTIALGSYAYQRDFEFKTYVAQLYSDWSDNFSTEAKVSFRDYSAVRTPVSNLPSIRINLTTPIAGTTAARNASVFLGTEENTHVNILETETYNAFFAGTYYAGDHQIKFGFDYEDNDIYNLFGRRSNGVYVFNSIAGPAAQSFQSGLSNSYRLFYPTGGDRNNAAAAFKLKNLGVFLQDTWSVNDHLTLNYGVRFDSPIIDDKPQYNSAAEAAFGFDNSDTIDGNNLVAPRFGFNYTFDGDLQSQLRGGVGLFQGAAANVWISNAYSNTGFGYTDYNYTAGSAPTGTPPRPGVGVFTPDPDNQLSIIPAGARGGTQSIDFIDPELGQPAVWKANLAFDQELPLWGIVASTELVLTQVKEAIYYQQLNLGSPTRTGQDGRVMFFNGAGYLPSSYPASNGTPTSAVGVRANQNRAFTDAIIARPTNKGRGEQLTLSLQKPFGESDWSWLASYTFTNATEVNPLTSSTSFSNYSNNAVFQANENVSSTSNYEIHDRFLGMVNWKHAFFGDSETRVSLVYEGRTGKPYSYVFDNDANGDGVAGNDLLYIPKAPGDVVFGSAAEEAAYFAFAGSDEYLSTHGGQVAKRNDAHSTWVNQFDLSFAQEIPGFFKDDKFEVTLDVLNIGNLINKKWGQIEEVGFPLSRGVVEYGGICTAVGQSNNRCGAGDIGKYVYRYNVPDPKTIYDDSAVSRWQLQVGVRYQF